MKCVIMPSKMKNKYEEEAKASRSTAHVERFFAMYGRVLRKLYKKHVLTKHWLIERTLSSVCTGGVTNKLDNELNL